MPEEREYTVYLDVSPPMTTEAVTVKAPNREVAEERVCEAFGMTHPQDDGWDYSVYLFEPDDDEEDAHGDDPAR